MDSPPKLRYEIDLNRPIPRVPGQDVEIRSISTHDVDGVARLMLDAYVGTIDHEGETFQDAVGEVESYFEGDPLLEHSYVASIADEIVSGVLLMLWEGGPLIRCVMTLPAHKNQGLGRLLVSTTMTSLHEAGHTQVTLFITEGNTASEALFEAVGAVHVP